MLRGCGFCKSVKHVIMSLVDHYKYSEHIRIARLVDVFCMLDLPRQLYGTTFQLMRKTLQQMNVLFKRVYSDDIILSCGYLAPNTLVLLAYMYIS